MMGESHGHSKFKAENEYSIRLKVNKQKQAWFWWEGCKLGQYWVAIWKGNEGEKENRSDLEFT